MKYAILERKDPESKGMPGIELENGLRFVVNNIRIAEETNPDGSGNLSFDYDLLCDPAFPKEEYEKMIGDWIVYVLDCALEDNTLDKLI